MLHTVLLVALGFLGAWLLAFLLAPVIWRRAARITEKRLKADLPLSFSDFQAEKDQMRAEFALKLRRIEVAQQKTQAKAAHHQVELGRLQVALATEKKRVRDLRAALAEKKSMATVLEQTVQKELPRLETENATLKEALEKGKAEYRRLEAALSEQGRALQQAEQNQHRLRAEIDRLRQALMGTSQLPAATSHAKVNGRGETHPALSSDEIRHLQEALAKAKQFQEKEAALLRQYLRQLGETLLSQIQPRASEPSQTHRKQKATKVSNEAPVSPQASPTEQQDGPAASAPAAEKAVAPAGTSVVAAREGSQSSTRPPIPLHKARSKQKGTSSSPQPSPSEAQSPNLTADGRPTEPKRPTSQTSRKDTKKTTSQSGGAEPLPRRQDGGGDGTKALTVAASSEADKAPKLQSSDAETSPRKPPDIPGKKSRAKPERSRPSLAERLRRLSQ